MTQDMGASANADRAVVNGAGQAVSALRASVPSAVIDAAPFRFGRTDEGRMILDKGENYYCYVHVEQCGGGAVGSVVEAMRRKIADDLLAALNALPTVLDELERMERNRDMWRAQCKRQADALAAKFAVTDEMERAGVAHALSDSVYGSNGGWPGYVRRLWGAMNTARLNAQAIEARRAETQSGSVHESAVGNADAPER